MIKRFKRIIACLRLGSITKKENKVHNNLKLNITIFLKINRSKLVYPYNPYQTNQFQIYIRI